jgi:hypothetical protein
MSNIDQFWVFAGWFAIVLGSGFLALHLSRRADRKDKT